MSEMTGAERIARRIRVAKGEEPADLVIRNARVVNVFTRCVETASVAVADGIIAGVYPEGEEIEGRKVVDAEGCYMIPGLIDAHTHVEMAYVSAVPFAEGIIPWGTTTVMLDPHDTVNAMGNDGMKMLADDLKDTPLKVHLMTPPCVPSSPIFEDAGFEVTLDSLKESMDFPLVHGIAETMDFGRVLRQEPELMKMIAYGRENGILFDGHAPCVLGRDAMAYFGSGPIRTDHESISVDEAYEKYGLGVHVIIRRGSLADPVHAGELVSRLSDTSRLLLATDGCISVNDIVNKGHMNYALSQIVAEGVDPMIAVQMATINVARAHRIDHMVGAIAPGLEADMVLVEDLKEFIPRRVFLNGEEIPKDYRLPRKPYPERALHSIKLAPLTEDRLKIAYAGDTAKVRAVTCLDVSLATTIDIEEMKAEGGEIVPDLSRDLLKGIVLERYGRGKGFSLGIIRGFGLKEGAIAGSIGQDTQNMAAIGTNDSDICAAVNAVTDMQGGVVLVSGGEIRAKIELPIFGIMTDKSFVELDKDFEAFYKAYGEMGGTLTDPVFTLSLLLTLVVIPEAGLSNRGLVDVLAGRFVDLIVE